MRGRRAPGATQFAFPATHPVQTAANIQLGRQGREHVIKLLGDVPSWLRGWIPVGIDAEGSPVLMNPTNMTPLGTGIDTAMALIDSVKLLRGDDGDTSGIFDQLNPLIDLVGTGPAFEHTPISKGIERVPQVALYQGLKHPGEGSKTFPGTRKEGLGRFVLGSAYPRAADREELTKQALKELPLAERYYREGVMGAEKAAKALGLKLTPDIVREIKMGQS